MSEQSEQLCMLDEIAKGRGAMLEGFDRYCGRCAFQLPALREAGDKDAIVVDTANDCLEMYQEDCVIGLRTVHYG